MSIAGAINSDKSYKKPYHSRNDSTGELDVFEAARYFSGYNEVVGYNNNNNGSGFTQKMIMREDQRHGQHRAGRISLDMPMRSLLPHQFHHGEKQHVNVKEKKKHKQPNSPGGRLASFLNSLFSSQSASKKKKSKSTTTHNSMKDNEDHESPGGRKWRRSSISHFRRSSTSDNSKSNIIYSSLSSGFRTPPYINVQTPTKSCKEFRTLISSSDHKQQKYNTNGHVNNSTSSSLQNEKKKREPETFLDESHKYYCRNGLPEKDKYSLEEKEFRKFDNNNEVDDDGADSDSSSDLFELQNYDLGYYPSGLPVYETTNMDNIKRGAPISIN